MGEAMVPRLLVWVPDDARRVESSNRPRIQLVTTVRPPHLLEPNAKVYAVLVASGKYRAEGSAPAVVIRWERLEVGGAFVKEGCLHVPHVPHRLEP